MSNDDLVIIPPAHEEFTMAFDTTKTLIYTLENRSNHVIRDFDIAVNTLKRKYLDGDTYVKTKEKYAYVQLPPRVIMPNKSATLEVKMELPTFEDYKEEASAKGTQKQLKKVAFKINMIVKSSQFIEGA